MLKSNLLMPSNTERGLDSICVCSSFSAGADMRRMIEICTHKMATLSPNPMPVRRQMGISKYTRPIPYTRLSNSIPFGLAKELLGLGTQEVCWLSLFVLNHSRSRIVIIASTPSGRQFGY